jgi:hypothetical protein
MSDTLRIACVPRPDATPASSCAAFARCYVYLVERRRQRTQEKAVEPAPEPDGRDDHKWLAEKQRRRHDLTVT